MPLNFRRAPPTIENWIVPCGENWAPLFAVTDAVTGVATPICVAFATVMRVVVGTAAIWVRTAFDEAVPMAAEMYDTPTFCGTHWNVYCDA